MEEEVEEEYKAAATVYSRRACPSGCPRAVRGGVTATRRQAALGKSVDVVKIFQTSIYFICKSGFDTAENEPLTICQKLKCFKN